MNVLGLSLDSTMINIALARAARHYREHGHMFTLRRAGNAASVEPRLDDPKWDLVIASTIFERTRALADRVCEVYPGGMHATRDHGTLTMTPNPQIRAWFNPGALEES